MTKGPKKDWNIVGAQNRARFAEATSNSNQAFAAQTKNAGNVKIPDFIKNRKAKEFDTTNGEEAKRQGTTARQISKRRNGKKK
jgi:hypothetical protein